MIAITDKQLDDLIDKARPDLRIALRSVMVGGQSAHFFNIGSQPFPNGKRWDIVCTILSQPLVCLVEGIINDGIPAMAEAYRDIGLITSVPEGLKVKEP